MSVYKKVDCKLTIVNALGQVVEVISGRSDPGIIDITWDATGSSCGGFQIDDRPILSCAVPDTLKSYCRNQLTVGHI